jgi:hypothetical protein
LEQGFYDIQNIQKVSSGDDGFCWSVSWLFSVLSIKLFRLSLGKESNMSQYKLYDGEMEDETTFNYTLKNGKLTIDDLMFCEYENIDHETLTNETRFSAWDDLSMALFVGNLHRDIKEGKLPFTVRQFRAWLKSQGTKFVHIV